MRFEVVLILLFAGSIYLSTTAQPSEMPMAEPDWQTTAGTDWLLDPKPFKAGVWKGLQDELILSNGLIRRVIQLQPNAATVAFDNLVTGEAILRGVKPEAIVVIDGDTLEVGGLTGQENYAFLTPQVRNQLQANPGALKYFDYHIGEPIPAMDWLRARHHDPNAAWPPRGVHLTLTFRGSEATHSDLSVLIHYELYDGLPVICKWMEVVNHGAEPMQLQSFTSELLAAVEYGAWVENREYQVSHPNIHVETDYAFASFVAEDANHHVVHWEPDPDYHTQVNYLKQTPCLLKVSPELGPDVRIPPGDTFTSYRTYVLPFDSYDRERMGLAKRRMYRTLAPWATENPLMMHARFADWDRVKIAIDQAAEVGFEMVILTFGSGFDVESEDTAYIEEMKRYADYAQAQGVELGGYSLLASRSINAANDVVYPEGQTPVFGNSPCIGSEWGQTYFKKLYDFYDYTGFSLLEHDGSYPGDICISQDHPGHAGYEDSRWKQYQTISDFYKWCRARGIYLNIPDYYYLTGGNKCGMGYREVNWSLPRAQQVIHTRQNIYDGTWDKLSTMGWMFVPLTEYHGGGAAATIEPLSEHLDHYERMMISNLGAGVQACYRGPRLYDSEETKQMVQSSITWFKQHRQVLEGDLIHLRRADARDLDYWLMVNPFAEERGALLVFNPLEVQRQMQIKVPLYYTGLDEQVSIWSDETQLMETSLDRSYEIELEVDVPPGGFKAYFFKEPR